MNALAVWPAVPTSLRGSREWHYQPQGDSGKAIWIAVSAKVTRQRGGWLGWMAQFCRAADFRHTRRRHQKERYGERNASRRHHHPRGRARRRASHADLRHVCAGARQRRRFRARRQRQGTVPARPPRRPGGWLCPAAPWLFRPWLCAAGGGVARAAAPWRGIAPAGRRRNSVPDRENVYVDEPVESGRARASCAAGRSTISTKAIRNSCT